MTFLNIKTYYFIKNGAGFESCVGGKSLTTSNHPINSLPLYLNHWTVNLLYDDIILLRIYIYIYMRTSNYFSALFFVNKIEYYPEHT